MTGGHQDGLPFRRYAARPNHTNLHSLGSIIRDGTTVHIPFLTTEPGAYASPVEEAGDAWRQAWLICRLDHKPLSATVGSALSGR